MARNFIVVLDSTPGPSVGQDSWPYPEDYFPRGFHYACDANDLVEHVERKGGKAHVVPRAQATSDLLRQCATART